MKSPLSNEELCVSARRGDASARNELVENNMGFIRKTAHELWSSQRELNAALLLDREDLEQEGAFGLLRCVDTFDPESGGKFLSYAAPAVRNTMLDSIRERSRAFEAQNIGSRISLESAALYGTGKTPEQLYLERESFEELHAALGRIEPRERGYIEYRFGFDDEDTERTLTQTARHFHLSESRARATERQALDDVRLELPWWY
ncbi:MAG: sigma-70 family RNA polymerase sigma factor [Candidatus Scatomorpha sp.]|jgi:RNA polymerase primary sigma factor